MASINQATVIGFIGEEPKIALMQSGRKVATFSVATTEKGHKRNDGSEVPDRTDWHNVVVWGKMAEVVEKYLHKGSSVYVQGKMRTRSYEDKNNITRYVTEIICDVMQLLDRKNVNPQNDSYVNQSPIDDSVPF